MTNKFSIYSKITACIIVTCSTMPVLAQSANDTIISSGWAHIAPQDSSTPLTITSPAIGPLAGSGASVDSTNTLGLSITHFYTDNLAVALDLGVPPKYTLNGTGTLAGVGKVGEAKQWAPTAIGKYYFGGSNDQFRPFVGLGLTYVRYSNISLTRNFQQVIGAKFSDPSATTSAELGSGWGPVFNIGASYAINKDWYAGLSLSYVRLKTTADLTTHTNTVGRVSSTTELTLNPIVAFISIGYRF